MKLFCLVGICFVASTSYAGKAREPITIEDFLTHSKDDSDENEHCVNFEGVWAGKCVTTYNGEYEHSVTFDQYKCRMLGSTVFGLLPIGGESTSTGSMPANTGDPFAFAHYTVATSLRWNKDKTALDQTSSLFERTSAEQILIINNDYYQIYLENGNLKIKEKIFVVGVSEPAEELDCTYKKK